MLLVKEYYATLIENGRTDVKNYVETTVLDELNPLFESMKKA